MNPTTGMHVAIVYNAYIPMPGRSGEAQVEKAVVLAARQVAAAVTAAGRCASLAPVGHSLTGLLGRFKRRRPDVLVNLCEGFAGQPRHEAGMAALWEMLDVPFTGNTADALALCRDKYRTKLVLQAAGIAVPPGWTARRAADVPAAARFPLIVKPAAEDGGIGIYPESVVHDRGALDRQIRRVTRRYAQPALVERFIAGREFNLAMIECRGQPRLLPIAEMTFRDLPESHRRIVGYQAKWLPQHACYRATVPRCPARVPRAASAALRRAARRAWTAVGLRGYARFDFRMDARGRVYLLEVNPNPDPSPDAGLARALQAAGMAYPDFWHWQIKTALGRRKGVA